MSLLAPDDIEFLPDGTALRGEVCNYITRQLDKGKKAEIALLTHREYQWFEVLVARLHDCPCGVGRHEGKTITATVIIEDALRRADGEIDWGETLDEGVEEQSICECCAVLKCGCDGKCELCDGDRFFVFCKACMDDGCEECAEEESEESEEESKE